MSIILHIILLLLYVLKLIFLGDFMDYGKRLAVVRVFYGINRSDFADSLNIPVGKLKNIELCVINFPQNILGTLEDKYRINSRWVLVGRGSMFIDTYEG